MGSTVILTSSPSLTVPLTTVFTPPSSCSHSWTYEAAFYNSVSGGLLIQNALSSQFDSACWPKSFRNNGRQPSAMLYSPGVCPEGYTTPVIQLGGSTTTAVCCQTGFTYSTTLTTINGFGRSSVVFEGCLSNFPSGSTTSVKARSEDEELNSTTIKGPVAMWGQPITIEVQPSDASLFRTTSSLSPDSSASAVTGPTTLVPTASSPSPTQTFTAQPASRLSGGQVAGIVVSVIAGLALLLAFSIFVTRRRRRGIGGQEPLAMSIERKGKDKEGYTVHPGAPGPEDKQLGELMGQELNELNAAPIGSGLPARGLHEMAG